MKKLGTLILAGIFGLSVNAQIVNPDFRTETINLLEPNMNYDLESFAILNSFGQDDAGVYLKKKEIIGSTSDLYIVEYERSRWESTFPEQSETLKDAIGYEMDIRGVDENFSDPDVIVQYHVYTNNSKDDAEYAVSSDSYDFAYLKKQDIMKSMSDGTVIVSVIDTEKGKSIWEGYAFEALDTNGSIWEKQQDLRMAVHELMERFNIDLNS